jgi:6-phosphofructokinase 1
MDGRRAEVRRRLDRRAQNGSFQEVLMKQIAVLTSGGDAPGMNAAIRAVVRSGLAVGWTVYGVQRGYAGLAGGNLLALGPRDVGGIIQLGGTILGSARFPDFRTEEGRRRALDVLRDREIDGLVVIGGNGSQTGAYQLSQLGFPVVGVASTIDNDLFGSDITIGVDSALNVALEAVDRLKVTASSHHRAFIVEVMGRDSGYLALMTAIAGGAEVVIIPEAEPDIEMVIEEINTTYARGKAHAIIVVAEGARLNAAGLMELIEAKHAGAGFELRATVLGHVQRGAPPTAFDRLLATRLGAGAVDRLAAGETGVLVGLHGSTVGTTPLEQVVSTPKPPDARLLELARVLGR